MTESGDVVRTWLEHQRALGPTYIVLPATPTSQATGRAPAAPLPTGGQGAVRSSPAAARLAPPAPVAPKRERPHGSTPQHPAPSLAEIPAGLTVEAPPADLFTPEPGQSAASLEAVAELVAVCTRCRLCESRTNAVPGEGPPDARLVVVGEGPGKTEDETGRPFVGQAGELLTKILAAIDLPREQVFICNVVKCRPPNNRVPSDDEVRTCLQYLYRQLALIRPSVILAVGGTAATALLETKASLGQLRGRIHRFRGVPLVVTYHPAALLRNPHWKRPTWDDIRIVRQLLDA